MTRLLRTKDLRQEGRLLMKEDPRPTTGPTSRRLGALMTRCALGGVLLLVAAGAASAQQAPQDEGWQFIITPYLWAIGLQGSTRIGQTLPDESIDVPFQSLATHLDMAAMGAFEARKGRWGIIFDGFYGDLSADSKPILNGALGTAQADFKQTMLELAVAVRPLENQEAFLDVLLGARYIDLNAKLSLFPSALLPAGAARSDSVTWTDGFVGLRGKVLFPHDWWLGAYADVGTGGSKLSYQGLVGVGIDFSKTFGMSFGYRYLHEDYSTTDFLYDIGVGGLFVGFGFTF
ncbi:MAG TPA: hypothetical protein VEH54_09635 [Steroidobacteraceae bacterium]|nr:hypothetical protein [Steroidobacteraceae bacterium]